MNDLQRATVGEAMHRGIITCGHGESLRTVAQVMAAHGVHCVVVFDEREEAGDKPFWGVVSDLDLAAGLIENDLDDRNAGQIAASPVITVPSDETLARAAQLMTANGSAHIVVVEPGTGKPVGVLSTLDLARFAAEGDGAAAGAAERSVER